MMCCELRSRVRVPTNEFVGLDIHYLPTNKFVGWLVVEAGKATVQGVVTASDEACFI